MDTRLDPTMMSHDDVRRVGTTLLHGRYPGATVAFAAGSIVRGEATRYSDLDLVVVHAHLPAAYRESFCVDGLAVEALVHDPQTLRYFMIEVDVPSGVPALPAMVHEGLAIPVDHPQTREFKQLAASLLAAGPAPLSDTQNARLRYFITDRLDDMRASRSAAELLASATQLYSELADYHLRTRGHWSAEGKSIPRALARVSPEFGERFQHAFERVFRHDDASAAIALAEAELAPHGGPLFDGYRSEAPPEFRTKP
jgi:hypothetical protein